MTRVGRDFADSMKKEAVPPVSADVIFATSRFPTYKIGANNQIVEVEDPKVLAMKEVIARETAQLLEQQKRLSVRDLASKFERGLAAAAKLSDEVSLCQLFGFIFKFRRVVLFVHLWKLVYQIGFQV
ncbi:hypothetical protein CsSME_00042214 [Camellia sinensis var. sinensis]